MPGLRAQRGASGGEGELGELFGVLAGPGNQSCCRSLPRIPVFSSSLAQPRSGCQHKQPLKEFSRMIQYFPLLRQGSASLVLLTALEALSMDLFLGHCIIV